MKALRCAPSYFAPHHVLRCLHARRELLYLLQWYILLHKYHVTVFPFPPIPPVTPFSLARFFPCVFPVSPSRRSLSQIKSTHRRAALSHSLSLSSPQIDSSQRRGARAALRGESRRLRVSQRRGVAVQVEFESRSLKPGSHISGSRAETRRFQSFGSTKFNLCSPTAGAFTAPTPMCAISP
jgi:hypothetical protein